MTGLPEEVRPYFAAANYAHLATLLPDGSPHVVPLWVDVEGDQLVFLTVPGSRKDRNIAADPRVALSVAQADHPFAMATARGRVTERIEGDRAWELIDRMAVKYTGGPYADRTPRVVFAVEVESAWAHDYAEG
jgi:PPOX class probable F420-dependent enzyme